MINVFAFFNVIIVVLRGCLLDSRLAGIGGVCTIIHTHATNMEFSDLFEGAFKMVCTLYWSMRVI